MKEECPFAQIVREGSRQMTEYRYCFREEKKSNETTEISFKNLKFRFDIKLIYLLLEFFISI